MSKFKILSAILLTFSIHTNGTNLNYPNLFFQYSYLYDGMCEPNNPIDPTWANEAAKRESEFANIWSNGSSFLFAQLFSEFGKGFSRKELTATLSVCNNMASISDPLILNVNRFLKSYMQNKPTRPDFAFVDQVFHELLHTWIIENVKFPTPLTLKYKNEPRSLIAHLHLMAIQKLIYTNLGRDDLLHWIDNLYPKMQGVYPRAWEIVTKTEGYEAFIDEIKKQ